MCADVLICAVACLFVCVVCCAICWASRRDSAATLSSPSPKMGRGIRTNICLSGFKVTQT